MIREKKIGIPHVLVLILALALADYLLSPTYHKLILVYKNFKDRRILEKLKDKDCIEFVSDIIDVIIEGLQNSEKVKIHNFGTFIVRNKKRRIGRNPKTKKEVMIDERKVISFKASKNVLKYLNSFHGK